MGSSDLEKRLVELWQGGDLEGTAKAENDWYQQRIYDTLLEE